MRNARGLEHVELWRSGDGGLGLWAWLCLCFVALAAVYTCLYPSPSIEPTAPKTESKTGRGAASLGGSPKRSSAASGVKSVPTRGTTENEHSITKT